jgi:hypothetical protein
VAEVGRPTDYNPEFVEQARKLCELGATDLELADFLKVDVSTVYRWKNTHPEFCEAVRVGKDACDDRVERSFYNRCVGYSFSAVKIFMPAGAEQPVYAPYTEHVPPDTGAALNWLKNRRKDDWRDKTEVDVNVNDLATELAKRRNQVTDGKQG